MNIDTKWMSVSLKHVIGELILVPERAIFVSNMVLDRSS